MSDTESTLARMRRGHVRDAWAMNPERCLLDGQVWPCDAVRLLDVAETARELDGGSRAVVTLDGDWSNLLVRTDTLERLRAALAALT